MLQSILEEFNHRLDMCRVNHDRHVERLHTKLEVSLYTHQAI